MKERCLARSVEDYEVLLTPEQVESYRESAVVRKSIINFGAFQDGSVFLNAKLPVCRNISYECK